MLIVALFVCEIEPNRTCVFVADSALLKRAQARFLGATSSQTIAQDPITIFFPKQFFFRTNFLHW